MNMHVLPWSINAEPDTDEDDSGRTFYLAEIQKHHRRARVEVPAGPEYYSLCYLCKRCSLVGHLVLLLKQRKINRKEYIELSLKLNIDIILELDKRKLLQDDGW